MIFRSFDRNGMETCGLKSSISLSSNLCQEFYKKQKQCSAKPCWWYEKRKSLLQALRSFMERQDAFLCFVSFRLPFLSLFFFDFFSPTTAVLVTRIVVE